jgi:hypothetical protein
MFATECPPTTRFIICVINKNEEDNEDEYDFEDDEENILPLNRILRHFENNSSVSTSSSVSVSINNDCINSIMDDEEEEDLDYYEVPLNQSAYSEKKYQRAKFIRLQNDEIDYHLKIPFSAAKCSEYTTPPPPPPHQTCENAESFQDDDTGYSEDSTKNKEEEEEEEAQPCSNTKEKPKKRKRNSIETKNIECWHSEPKKVDISSLVWANHFMFGWSCGRIIREPPSQESCFESDHLCKVEFFNLPKYLPRPSKKPFAQCLKMEKKNCIRRCRISKADNENYYNKLYEVWLDTIYHLNIIE